MRAQMLVSPKTYSHIFDDERVYYFFPDDTCDIVAIEPVADIYAPYDRGFIMIDGVFVTSIIIE